MKHWKIHEGLSAPVNVTWEVTNKCNLSCIHCLSASGRTKRAELNLAQCYGIIDQLASQEVFQVNFGGGEPFARPDFLSIVDECHCRGLVTCISTNGTFFGNEVLGFLRGKEMVYVQVSLDGASPDTNDRIRGAGTFKRILKGIERLYANDIPFSINMVLTSWNFSEISSLYALAGNFDAKLRISRFRPSGRGAVSWDYLRLRKEDLKAFSQWLSEHQDVATGDSFFSLEAEQRKGLGLNLCGAAKFTCCINPAGEVYPCAFLHERFFYGGSLLSQPLSQIWLHARAFALLRNLKIHSCEHCFKYDSCYGGCPAIGYFTEKALGVADPECLAQCITNA